MKTEGAGYLISLKKSDIIIIVSITAFMYISYLLMVTSGFCLIHWEDSIPVRTGSCLGYVWHMGWTYLSFMDLPAIISGIAIGVTSMKLRRTFKNAILISLLTAPAPNSCQYILANSPSYTPYIAGLLAGAVGTLTRILPTAFIIALLIYVFSLVCTKWRETK